MSVSSSKIDNPKDVGNKDNPPDGAQKNAAEQDVKITKTIQHLLSDWRTAYNKSRQGRSENLFRIPVIKGEFFNFPNNYNH